MMLALGGEIASIAGGEIFTNSATFLFRFLSLTPMGSSDGSGSGACRKRLMASTQLQHDEIRF
jgi:hypothetical protein